MALSPINYCRSGSQQQHVGMTLIEVLIALAIVGIALTAVIKATSQNIRSTTYLQTKTIALWVGEQVINEARLGLIKLPAAPDKLDQTTEMLGREWYWQINQEETPNKRINKIAVNVFAKEPSAADAYALLTLESYIYHADEN